MAEFSQVQVDGVLSGLFGRPLRKKCFWRMLNVKAIWQIAVSERVIDNLSDQNEFKEE